MISFAICATQTVFAWLLSLTVIFQAWCIVHAKVSFFDYFHLPYHVYQAHTLSPFFYNLEVLHLIIIFIVYPTMFTLTSVFFPTQSFSAWLFSVAQHYL